MTTRLALRTGALLLVATGFVDAYLFVAHGHVFAEAQTGNLVLVAVGVVEPDLIEFWRPLLAYVAFVAGVSAAWTLHRPWAPPVVLATQAVVLAVVAALPAGFPNPVVVAVIAGCAGLQAATFGRLGSVAFSTVVMTSNTVHTVTAALRTAAGEKDQRDDARQFAVALGSFVVGVFAGAAATHWLDDRAALIAAAGYAGVLVLYLRRSR